MDVVHAVLTIDADVVKWSIVYRILLSQPIIWNQMKKFKQIPALSINHPSINDWWPVGWLVGQASVGFRNRIVFLRISRCSPKIVTESRETELSDWPQLKCCAESFLVQAPNSSWNFSTFSRESEVLGPEEGAWILIHPSQQKLQFVSPRI